MKDDKGSLVVLVVILMVAIVVIVLAFVMLLPTIECWGAEFHKEEVTDATWYYDTNPSTTTWSKALIHERSPTRYCFELHGITSWCENTIPELEERLGELKSSGDIASDEHKWAICVLREIKGGA